MACQLEHRSTVARLFKFLDLLLSIFFGATIALLNAARKFFPFTVVEMLGPWVSYGFIVAAGLGIVSGLVPAVRAAQLSVIDGLGRVA